LANCKRRCIATLIDAERKEDEGEEAHAEQIVESREYRGIKCRFKNERNQRNANL
jgi:hypothetical protein